MEDVPFKHKALLVEDNDRLTQWVREYLDSYTFSFHGARRKNAALNALREHRLALMILELMPPNLDDMAACHRIRKLSSVPC
ncbi:response regulator [Mycetohabitans sp. B46]|uniref:response regulator n=1 Tax=Mycetohabitans sp. B46 TaxID=2772536 RepID=UPI003FD2E1D9